MTINKQEAKTRAQKNWKYWRLLVSNMGIMYSDLDRMDDDDIEEANAALDIYIEQQKKNLPKK